MSFVRRRVLPVLLAVTASAAVTGAAASGPAAAPAPGGDVGLGLSVTTDPVTYDHAGQRLTYIFRVTNAKSFTVRDLGVYAVPSDHDDSCVPAALPAGQTATCTATVTVNQGDLDHGFFDAYAYAHGRAPDDADVVSDEVRTTLRADQKAGIKLVTAASPQSFAAPGEIIDYAGTATNTGNVTLRQVEFVSSRLGRLDCRFAELAPGETVTCHSAGVTTQADVDAGGITNETRLDAIDRQGLPVTDEDKVTVTAIHQPAITLDTTAFPTEYATPGETVTYTYTVTDTGNVSLRNIALHDSQLGRLTCPLTALAPAQSVQCTAGHVVTQDDLDRGEIVNRAGATGETPTGQTVTGSDTATVHADDRPGLQLAKAASPRTFGAAGETIDYTYTVANTGNRALHRLLLSDNRLSVIPCPSAELAAGASMTCHASYVTTQSDVDRGDIENHAFVNGLSPGDLIAHAGASDAVPATGQAGINLVTSAFPATYGTAGEAITYRYTVTNAGHATLRNIALADDKLGAVTCPLAELAPGRSTTCASEHVTTQADLDAGQITSAAAVTADPPAGPPVTAGDTATVTAVRAPGVEVQKTPFPAEYGAAGEVIEYDYTVVDTGDGPLRDVELRDNRFGRIGCPRPALSAGQSMSCSADKDITEADIAAGRFSNLATVTAVPPQGAPVGGSAIATVYAGRRPGIAIRKTAVPGTYTGFGSLIHYTYRVVNTGDVAVHGLTLADDHENSVKCTASTLEPGATTFCFAPYITGFDDASAGHVTNIVTAAARTPDGTQVTAGAEATIWEVAPAGVPVTG